MFSLYQVNFSTDDINTRLVDFYDYYQIAIFSSLEIAQEKIKIPFLLESTDLNAEIIEIGLQILVKKIKTTDYYLKSNVIKHWHHQISSVHRIYVLLEENQFTKVNDSCELSLILPAEVFC